MTSTERMGLCKPVDCKAVEAACDELDIPIDQLDRKVSDKLMSPVYCLEKGVRLMRAAHEEPQDPQTLIRQCPVAVQLDAAPIIGIKEALQVADQRRTELEVGLVAVRHGE